MTKISCGVLLVVLIMAGSSFGAVPDYFLDYVAREDGVWEWRATGSETVRDVTVHYLEFESQVWQGITWSHRLHLIEPNGPMLASHPLLYITGSGSGQDEIRMFAEVTSAVGIPIAILHDIPNQPLFSGLREDALIAYTFSQYLLTNDATWPLLFPMAKAAVRAMDTIEAFRQSNSGVPVQGFIVSGGSKRGWTTWFTAAADSRVKAIAPAVYDNLNLPAQMEHQLAAWGEYSYQIRDYTRLGLPDMIQDDAGAQLATVVDPFSYLDRINVPILLIMGTNDPYWPVDALNLYWDDLPEPKYIYYGANAGHSMDGAFDGLLGTLVAFYLQTVGLLPLPTVDWTFTETDAGLNLSVASSMRPTEVKFWSAQSPTRDLRPATWSSQPGQIENNIAEYQLPLPESGWSALYAEVEFQFLGQTYSLCSQIQLISQ